MLLPQLYKSGTFRRAVALRSARSEHRSGARQWRGIGGEGLERGLTEHEAVVLAVAGALRIGLQEARAHVARLGRVHVVPAEEERRGGLQSKAKQSKQ